MNGKELSKQIRQLLDSQNIPYQHEIHEETPRSIDAAKIRGTKLKEGVKALIFVGKKSGKNFLINIPGHLKVDTKKIKELVGEPVEMEKPEIIESRYGLQIGGVSPFGNLLGIPTYFDKRVLDEPRAAFNCGLRTESIIMSSENLVKIVGEEIGDYT